MQRHITRACVAAAAALALTAAGVTEASASVSGASGSGPRPPQAVQVSSAWTSHAAASSGTQLWVKRYNGHGTDDASSVAVSPSGKRVFVTGRSQGTAGTYDYAIVAYNAATGAQLWVKRYDGPGSIDEASSVAVSPSGKAVFVTGQSFGASGGVEYATVAYNAATGAQLWVKRYDDGRGGHGQSEAVKRYHGTASGDDRAYSVVVSPSGKSVFVTGSSEGAAGTYDYATVAYNAATGSQLWVKRYSGPGKVGEAYSVAVSPSGKTVYVTGSSWKCVCGGLEYATIAYKTATGAQLWVKRYGSPGGGGVAVSMVVSRPAGTVFVTGYSIFAVTGFDYVTIAYKG